MIVLIDYLKIELIGGRVVTAAELDTLSCAALHLREAEGVADDQLFFTRAQAQQSLAHVLAHATRARLAQCNYQANMREVSPDFFGAHNDAADVTHNATEYRS